MMNYDLGDFDEKKVKEIADKMLEKVNQLGDLKWNTLGLAVTVKDELEAWMQMIEDDPQDTYYRDVDIENKIECILELLEELIKDIKEI